MFFATPTQQTVEPTTVPAPIGGLNARDSLVAMGPTDAIRLVNFWPTSYGVAVRRGYKKWATGMVDPVETIGQWSSINGTAKMFAFAGSSIWDVTVAGPVGVPLVTGLASARWDLVSLVNAAGSHLIGVNGEDNAFVYDETGAHEIIVGNGTDPYTWSGLDPTDAINVELHQRRLWVVGKESSIGYFLPPDAVYGVFKSFDFGPLFYKGGYLEFISTWTMDDGNGAEDHLVAVSNTGIAVVYAGTDPEDDTKWGLVGVYNVGQPVKGGRAYTKAGGDLYLLTAQGVVSMAIMLVSTKVNEASTKFKSDKIQSLISKLVNDYGANPDWQLLYVPAINMLIINVPTGIFISNQQLVSNQIIDAWAEFFYMDASVWTTVSTLPFFGTYDGMVCQAWTGNLDGVEIDGTGGTSITTEVQQAYNYFGKLGTNKQIGLYRPNWVVNSNINYTSTILYDFGLNSLETPASIPPTPESLWGTALWGFALWSSVGGTNRNWQVGEGMGTAASIAMKTRSSTEALWVSTDFAVLDGGIL